MREDLPRISIVTPSYNQGQYIEQTICSVLDQDYPNLEYIIIDGGSTDNTIDIIKKYANRITYWISEPDGGQTEAINKGFAKCTGDIFNWINSDDYYEPGSFFKIATWFSSRPGIDVLCGKEWGFEDGNPDQKRLHSGSVIKKDVYETIRTGIIDQPCTFWRKNCIENYFPLDKSIRFVMDRQLWWQYLLEHGQKRIWQVDDIYTYFRLHPQSKSVSEGDLFEKDFEKLQYDLFKHLKAPAILSAQVLQSTPPLQIQWVTDKLDRDHTLAAFAFYYARRNYVKDNWQTAQALMTLVRKWKNINMNAQEWKLWLKVCVLPKSLLKILKKTR